MKVTQKDRCWIVLPEGYFNSEAGEEVKRVFDDFMKQSATTFLVDCSQITLINSLGLSYLTEVLEVLEDSERKLAFCSCSPIVDKTLRIMGMDQYATLYPDASAFSD